MPATVELSELQKVANIRPEDSRTALREGQEWVQKAPVPSAGGLQFPSEGKELTIDLAVTLIDYFRKVVVENQSEGNVATCFGHIVLYTVGTSDYLSELQKWVIQSACAIVRRRPLPALRWGHFVLSNLDEPRRIRLLLTACRRSKKMLGGRLREVFGRAGKQLGFSEKARIMAVGYSQTVADVIRGIAEQRPSGLVVRAPALISPRRSQLYSEILKANLEQTHSIRVDVVSEGQAVELFRSGEIDVLLSGCKVIARTDSGRIEIVNSRSCVDMCKEAAGFGVPVVVVGGLYKIWPTRFYERHKWSTVELSSIDGRLLNGVLDQDDIAWIVNELGHFRPPDFVVMPLARPFFEVQTFDIPCALAACRDDKELEDAIDRLGDTLERLSILETSEEQDRTQIHPETIEWLQSGKLPEHFRQAREYFSDKLHDDQWYGEHKGKYVAVVFDEQQAHIETSKDVDALLRKTYAKWGYRPIFTAPVVRSERIRVLRPRHRAIGLQ